MDCSLRMGDLLYRTKDFVEHAGVYLGNGLVFHISPANGAETISLSEYSAGLIVKVIHTDFDNKHLLEQRLREVIGSANSYSVSSNNCEHIASYLIYGEESEPTNASILLWDDYRHVARQKNGQYQVLLEWLYWGALLAVF